MNRLGLAVCSVVFCFLTSDEVIRSSQGETVDETLDSISSDWGTLFQMIGNLASKVDKMKETLKTIASRLDILEQRTHKGSGSDATYKDFKDSKGYKEIKKDIKKLKDSLAKCCSKKGGDKTKVQTGPSRNLTIGVDDTIELYLDGKHVNHFEYASKWHTPDIAILPDATKIIAVKGINAHGDPGVLGSTADGYVITNTSWKCTNKGPKGWVDADFDDSDWPSASVVLPYSEKPVAGVREDADWIWTKDKSFKKGDRIAYCRLHL